ncbi:hypothetical protein GJ496_008609 [Pomphorhynchus laevis]|nr:hypothetical protein GJ496_008609 [Pomphorhynchus laevis]
MGSLISKSPTSPEQQHTKNKLVTSDFDNPSYRESYTAQGYLLTKSRELAEIISNNIDKDKPITWEFSEEELSQLKNSINRVRFIAHESGNALFKRVFNYDQAFKCQVQAFQNFTKERVDSLFNTHADRVLCQVSQTIDNLNNVDYVFEQLKAIAVNHCNFSVNESHMDLMLCNFLEVVQRFDWECWCSSLEHVWIKFLEIVLAIIIVFMRNKLSK